MTDHAAAPTDAVDRFRGAEDQREARRLRKARRHAFWEDLSDWLLSMPAWVGMRMGG